MEKRVIINGEEHHIHIINKTAELLSFDLNGKEYHFDLIKRRAKEMNLHGAGKRHHIKFEQFKPNVLQLFVEELEAYIELPGKVQGASESSSSADSLQSPMPGKIFKIFKKKGDSVKQDEAILIMEAMKMEHTIRAHKDGIISEIYFTEGEQVLGGVKLAEIE